MPDPIDHATGLEKKELLAALAGNDDPVSIVHRTVLRSNAVTRNIFRALHDFSLLSPQTYDSSKIIM